MRSAFVGSIMAFALAGTVGAQPGGGEPMAVITRFAAAVNGGDGPGALAHLGPSPTIVDDLAPYRWQGPDAGAAWMNAMGANAQARSVTVINMRLLKPTRVEVTEPGAYAVVPGILTYTFKDGHTERAEGVLTFTLRQANGAWKIDALTWAGPREKP